MGMKCKCGGEIDLLTGRCKKCSTQNFTLRGNASIRMKERNGDATEIHSRNPCESCPYDYGSPHCFACSAYKSDGPTIVIK